MTTTIAATLVVLKIGTVGILITRNFRWRNAVNTFDKFDALYCNKVCDAVWAAIIDASREPGSEVSPIRNREAYLALINVMAMMLATSHAPPHVTDRMAAQFRDKLVERMSRARKAMRDAVVVGRKDFN